MRKLAAILAILAALSWIGMGMLADCGAKQQRFTTFDGIALCYFDTGGAGRPVILLHGLLVDSETNFGLGAYADTGRRVILLDARGHGCSAKPHAPGAYANRAMARDVLALIEHLRLPSADLLGYSMGGYTAIEAALIDDRRIGALILGGVGHTAGAETWFRDRAAEMLADTPDPDAVYRSLADDLGADRRAIGAWFQGAVLPQITGQDDLSGIDATVHILNAVEDEDPEPLAARFQRSAHGRFAGDHLSVLENPAYSARIAEILRATAD